MKKLFIFHRDNTLVAPYKEARSGQWFVYEINTKTIDEILPEYVRLEEKITLFLTELNLKEMFDAFKSLQDVVVIAVTARPGELEQRTVGELDRLGIYFSQIFLEKDILNNSLHYHKGILFCGYQDKGMVLKKYLTVWILSQTTSFFQMIS